MNSIRVMMAPAWRDHNPYLDLLAESLEKQGVSVSYPVGYQRVLPLWRACRKEGHKIVVLHLHWYEAYVKGDARWTQVVYGLKLVVDLMLIRASGTRIVWTMHNEVPHNTQFGTFYSRIQRVIAGIASSVIVHHAAVKERVALLLGRSAEKLAIIPHGHYRAAYGPLVDSSVARNKLSLPTDGVIFLVFGFLWRYKGVEDLLEAWALLETDTRSATLLIVGDAESGEYKAILTRLTARMSNVILRVKFIAPEEVSFYFCASDYAVFPFRRILTSGSLSLALSYGIPVIAPSFPSIRPYVESADGFLFKPLDVNSLADAIRPLLTQRRGLRENNSNHLLPDWSEVAKATKTVYEQCLEH
jgi:beta-1,4-mannosyltransferase